MDAEEFAALKASIATGYNVQHPIILHKNMILDGRHRYEACLQCGTNPVFVTKDDINPYEYVRREHEARRSWKSQEQKAIVLCELFEKSDEWAETERRIKAEANRARAEAAKGNDNAAKTSEEKTVVPQPVAQLKSEDDATDWDRIGKTQERREFFARQEQRRHKSAPAKATMLGVNRGAVERAEIIKRKAPELAEKVASGELPASKAITIIKKNELDKAKQAIAEQTKQEPNAPRVEVASYREWLPRQEQCDLLLTDPPYSTDVDNVADFAREWLPMALAKVKPTGRAFIFIGAYPEELQAYLATAMPAQILVWTYRNTLGPSPKHDYKLNWQAILYYRMPEAPPLDCPVMLEQFSVQDINAPDGRQFNRYHEWQKPDEIAERFIRHATRPGEIVMDPFCCTGTFPLVASRLGRVGIGCDISADNLRIAEDRGCLKVA